MAQRTAQTPVTATAGFAADERGSGIAYVRLDGAPGRRLVRIPFTVVRYPALLEREVGYAALTAIAARLRELGVVNVRFAIEDTRLVDDLRERRELPPALSLAYVRLGCALNQLRSVAVIPAPAEAADLTARARAEVAMHVAA